MAARRLGAVAAAGFLRVLDEAEVVVAFSFYIDDACGDRTAAGMGWAGLSGDTIGFTGTLSEHDGTSLSSP